MARWVPAVGFEPTQAFAHTPRPGCGASRRRSPPAPPPASVRATCNERGTRVCRVPGTAGGHVGGVSGQEHGPGGGVVGELYGGPGGGAVGVSRGAGVDRGEGGVGLGLEPPPKKWTRPDGRVQMPPRMTTSTTPLACVRVLILTWCPNERVNPWGALRISA